MSVSSRTTRETCVIRGSVGVYVRGGMINVYYILLHVHRRPYAEPSRFDCWMNQPLPLRVRMRVSIHIRYWRYRYGDPENRVHWVDSWVYKIYELHVQYFIQNCIYVGIASIKLGRITYGCVVCILVYYYSRSVAEDLTKKE